MNKLGALCAMDRHMMQAFSQRTAEGLTRHSLFGLLLPAFQSFLDINVRKEVEKDRRVLATAAAALKAGKTPDAQRLLAEARDIDQAFLRQATIFPIAINIHYGDIAHADTLHHAGIAEAEIIILSVPDSLLKGTSNEKLVRHVRVVNPTAKIIATADVLAETQTLYAAGADYVTIARLEQANELVEAVTAAEAGLLDDMRAKLEAQLRDRREILP